MSPTLILKGGEPEIDMLCQQTRSGALHVLLSFAVIVIFPIMATVIKRWCSR